MFTKKNNDIDFIGLYSIRDIVAEEFGPIFQCKNDAVAIRQYKNLIVKSKLLADDFQLFHIADMSQDYQIKNNKYLINVDKEELYDFDLFCKSNNLVELK